MYEFVKGQGWIPAQVCKGTMQGIPVLFIARKPEIGERFSWVPKDEPTYQLNGQPLLDKFANAYIPTPFQSLSLWEGDSRFSWGHAVFVTVILDT